MLGHATKRYVLDPEELHDSNLPQRIRKDFEREKRVLESIHKRLSDYIKKIDGKKSGGYTVFGMLLGDKSLMPKVDYDYCWEKVYGKYKDFDHSKRVLGTLLMYIFTKDDRYWLFVDDPEKKNKLQKGDIPEATQYFLEQDGSKFSDMDWPDSMRQGLASPNEILRLQNKFKREG